MKISSAELTALDLLRYPHAAGGLDHIVTVLADLGARIDPAKLASLSPEFERPVIQRTGWLLDHFGYRDRTDELHARFMQETQRPWTELEPAITRHTDLTPPPLEKNKRWNIIVRRVPEGDE